MTPATLTAATTTTATSTNAASVEAATKDKQLIKRKLNKAWNERERHSYAPCAADNAYCAAYAWRTPRPDKHIHKQTDAHTHIHSPLVVVCLEFKFTAIAAHKALYEHIYLYISIYISVYLLSVAVSACIALAMSISVSVPVSACVSVSLSVYNCHKINVSSPSINWQVLNAFRPRLKVFGFISFALHSFCSVSLRCLPLSLSLSFLERQTCAKSCCKLTDCSATAAATTGQTWQIWLMDCCLAALASVQIKLLSHVGFKQQLKMERT